MLKEVMKQLEPPDCHHLRAAQGWLDLGDPKEANEELKQISLVWRFHREVLLAGWEIYPRGEHWEFAYPVALAMVAMIPNDPAWLINRYVAFHHMN